MYWAQSALHETEELPSNQACWPVQPKCPPKSAKQVAQIHSFSVGALTIRWPSWNDVRSGSDRTVGSESGSNT